MTESREVGQYAYIYMSSSQYLTESREVGQDEWHKSDDRIACVSAFVEGS